MFVRSKSVCEVRRSKERKSSNTQTHNLVELNSVLLVCMCVCLQIARQQQQLLQQQHKINVLQQQIQVSHVTCGLLVVMVMVRILTSSSFFLSLPPSLPLSSRFRVT